ncbi:MAG: hypothetical protein VYE54_11985 [Pseudomonadota bacterium]|nr:hypothetical protein [Pseudomonadota bacterium]
MSFNEGPDWPSIILSSEFLKRLEWIAEKRFPQPALAQAAVNDVLERLSAENWHKLSSFGGKSKPETYAQTVASRLLEDYARERFGRPRPPKWLKESGAIWVQIWQMLCLERQWPAMVTSRLGPDHRPGLIEEIIRTIRAKIPRCGEPGYCEQLGDEDTADGGTTEALETQLSQQRHREALELLSNLLRGTHGDCPSTSESAFAALLEHVNLNPEDQLLLALIYEDGLSTRKAAEVLNTNPSAIQRRLQVITQSLRDFLQEWGIDGDSLTEVGYDA